MDTKLNNNSLLSDRNLVRILRMTSIPKLHGKQVNITPRILERSKLDIIVSLIGTGTIAPKVSNSLPL